MDALRVVGHDFKAIGERNLVVSIKARHHGKAETNLLQRVGVKSHLLQIGYTQELISCVTRVDQWT